VALRQVHAGDPPEELARVERLADAWEAFKRLSRSGGLDPADERARRATEERVGAIMEPATGLAAEMAAIEADEARESQAQAEATYAAARSRILLLSAGAALVWLVVALALVRNRVPRLRS
jgi:CHASE3 domain sensor protein